MVVTRRDFQQLAEARAQDAAVLLGARRPHGAYYLAGYAVEMAIKACIAGKTRRFEFPDQKRAQQVNTHNLVELLKAADLWTTHQQEFQTNRQFRARWTVVDKWSVHSRYERRIRAQQARDMVAAVTDSPDGVLEWLRKHWNR